MYTHCVFIAISIFDVPPRELQTLALSLVPTAAQHAYVTDACAQAILLSCMPLLCVTCCFCSGTLRLLLNAPQLVGYCAMRDALLFAHYPTSQSAAALARNNQRTWHGNTSTTSRVLPQRHTNRSTTSRVLRTRREPKSHRSCSVRPAGAACWLTHIHSAWRLLGLASRPTMQSSKPPLALASYTAGPVQRTVADA